MTKKVPCIPPIFHDNKFVTYFSKKADFFNSFFAKQCSNIENNSVLPYYFSHFIVLINYSHYRLVPGKP